jgi:anaphase-promoting complex subunit 3
MDPAIFTGDEVLMKENQAFAEPPSVFQPLSSNNSSSLHRSPSPSPLREKQHWNVQTELGDFLMQFGKAYQALTRFETDEAIVLFNQLPAHQLESGWVLCHLAKCYHESYDFNTCIETFQKAYRNEPQRIDDIDIYSSALWYEKRGTDLCYLLHGSLKKAYHAP